MHWILIICAACAYVIVVPATTTAMTLLGIAILTYVTEKTANALTGASFTTTESLRSVGMSFLFLGCYCLVILLSGGMQGAAGTVIKTGQQFGGMGIMALTAGVFIAYIAGFKVALGINMLIASVIAMVTSTCSIAMLLIARPYL